MKSQIYGRKKANDLKKPMLSLLTCRALARHLVHIPGIHLDYRDDILQSLEAINNKGSFEGAQVMSYTLGRNIREGRFGNVVNITTAPFNCKEKLVMKIQNQENFPKVVQNEILVYEYLLSKYDQVNSLITLPKAIFTNKTIAYFVFKKYNGNDLFDLLMARGKLSEHESKTIFQRVLHIISVLHKNRIVHRDIKPENILFDLEKEYDFHIYNF